jgi:predicted nucleotidyltransferase
LGVISDAQLADVEAALRRLGTLDALWLFGSEASGTATARSDIDFAALFAVRPRVQALLATRGELEVSLGRPVDLIDLETVSLVLAMQVVRHGRLVREHDARHRVRFVAALPGRYEDVMLMRRPAEKLLLMRLGNGRA